LFNRNQSKIRLIEISKDVHGNLRGGLMLYSYVKLS
jgi:hypothetical protein